MTIDGAVILRDSYLREARDLRRAWIISHEQGEARGCRALAPLIRAAALSWRKFALRVADAPADLGHAAEVAANRRAP